MCCYSRILAIQSADCFYVTMGVLTNEMLDDQITDADELIKVGSKMQCNNASFWRPRPDESPSNPLRTFGCAFTNISISSMYIYIYIYVYAYVSAGRCSVERICILC